MKTCILTSGTALAFCIAGITPVHAEEGLWTFDNFPSARLRATYGVDIDQGWLNHVQEAEVRLPNGCSASLVSATGLVLTNNHCVTECVQSSTSAGSNAYADGYVARLEEDEKRCDRLGAEVLTSITDVTPEVTRARAGLTGTALIRASASTTGKIEGAACANDPTSRCEVVSLYRGGQFKLYKYRVYSDVRLVFSPGVTMSTFAGGDFPPQALDAAFLRLYVGDKPAETPVHLKWNAAAPKAGELVFVAGNPRISERQLTVSQLSLIRGMTQPMELVQAAELIGRLTRFGEESADNKRASQYQLDDLSNHYHYVLDLLSTLNDDSFFAQKVAEEDELRRKAGPSMQTYWTAMAEAQKERRDQTLVHDYVETGPSSDLFTYARLLVRGAIERTKPSSERLPAFADNRLAIRETQLFRDDPIYAPLEQLQLEFWLSAARQYMTADDEIKAHLFANADAATLATRLSQSKLGDVALRRRLWVGGLPAIQASDDPMIRYVLQLEPVARAVQTKWEQTVTGPESRAAAAIGKARVTVYGGNAYPDASRSLRLSYGKIDGLTNGGKVYPPFSTLGDLFRSAAHDGSLRLDPRWIAARDRLTPATVLNMSTTNDGINGNSGSPLLNGRGEVVGAFFGGNSDAMKGNYGYDAKLNRAFAVSAAAVSEALQKVYSANRLSQELAGANK